MCTRMDPATKKIVLEQARIRAQEEAEFWKKYPVYCPNKGNRNGNRKGNRVH